MLHFYCCRVFLSLPKCVLNVHVVTPQNPPNPAYQTCTQCCGQRNDWLFFSFYLIRESRFRFVGHMTHTSGFQAGSPPSHWCNASTITSLEKNSRAPHLMLIEGNQCLCRPTISQPLDPLSLNFQADVFHY